MKRRKTSKGHRSALTMLEAALELFEEQGYAATTMRNISERTGFSLGAVYRHFATKESLALALYERLAVDLEDWITAMPEGTMAERFEATMKAKLALIEPHRPVLKSLFGKALNPEEQIGVLSEYTARIRMRVSAVFTHAVQGASDAPEDVKKVGRLLYGLHLALVFVWMQDEDPERRATEKTLSLSIKLLGFLPVLSAFPGASLLGELDGLACQLLRIPEEEKASERTQHILQCLLRRHRSLPGTQRIDPEDPVFDLHRAKIQAALEQDAPIQMVLPAFPAKAPNAQKVLGAEADMAEWLALHSLQELCEEITELHPPGVQLTICSDGHVFADLVGVDDSDVDLYISNLSTMLAELETNSIRLFDMGDAFGDMEPDGARAKLMETYARPIEVIRERAKASQTYSAQINGIHRFLFEDEIVRNPKRSRNQARKQLRPQAYEVVQRSEAWGRLVSTCFPEALRLSIHPQPLASQKLGVHLIDVEDVWLTPWHGVAVLQDEQFSLMKKGDAEELGAVIVDAENNQPAYMEING